MCSVIVLLYDCGGDAVFCYFVIVQLCVFWCTIVFCGCAIVADPFFGVCFVLFCVIVVLLCLMDLCVCVFYLIVLLWHILVCVTVCWVIVLL